ncbi:peptidyl-prolyl cis-trans isomerase cpr6, partial [Oleoguttula sp. CCFEE 5521]
IAEELKGMGNTAFKGGENELGLSKYQKALRYLNEYGPADNDAEELQSRIKKLRISLHTNSALLQYKLKDFPGATKSADNVLAIEGISDIEKAKALFRKGLVAKDTKSEEEALDLLTQAGKLAPQDTGIGRELAAVKKAAADRKAKEKKAYAKMFD